MSWGKRSHHILNLAFLLAVLVTIVVAVPTSVLVQNSEVTSNINAANNGHNLMTKVKRSSNNANELMSKVASNDAASTSANKKSSPEVLPPAYNMPMASQQSTGNNLSNGAKVNDGANTKTNSIFDRQTAGTLSMQSNEDIINSAIAAGLTAAAVEAAAAASQREMAEQQLKQQAQPYGDENTPTLLHKRGISSPQYTYGGMGGMGMGGPYGYGSVNGNNKGNDYESGNNGNSGYGGGDYFSNPYLYLNTAYQVGSGGGIPAVPTGFWADEMDPSVVYTDIQDDDFLNAPRASSYRNKAYDNLQNILNSEAYPEPMALSLPQPQYTSQYYGAINDNKRSNRYDNNNGGSGSSSGSGTSRFTDMRLKRDTKLTPADMLALVALVEAGERARKDTDTEASNNNYMYPSTGIAAASEPYNNYNGVKTYYPTTANMEGSENRVSWLEPNMMDYYAMPMNLETIPKYELQREHKYGGALAGGNGNRFGIKRFMVSKKKRSMGNFLNEPVSKPSLSYNVNNEKFY